MDVAPELVERLARQCRLELSPEELREAAEDLGRMLGRMGALDRLDTSGAEPMYRVSPEVNVLRGDEKAPPGRGRSCCRRPLRRTTGHIWCPGRWSEMGGMELAGMTALELGAAIRRGEVSVPEAVRAALDAVQARDGALNAFITVTARRALERAERLQPGAKSARSPLYGVPMAIKDNICTRG